MLKFFLAIKNKIFIVLFIFITSYLFSADVDWRAVPPPANFLEAKTLLLELYQECPKTFYCGCTFNKQGMIDRKTCPSLSKLPDDMFILEWEHIVPASLLGAELQCWTAKECSIESIKSHRACCQKTSKQFQLREANLYNIVPAIKYANRQRSNFKPGLVLNKRNAVKICNILIDKNKKIFEPDDEIKGFIARNYLRMHQLYQFKLSTKDKSLLEEWAKTFPATEWELKREFLINQIYNFE